MEQKVLPKMKKKISLLSQEDNQRRLTNTPVSKKDQEEVRQILIKEIEDDIIGPRLGPEEEINANPTSEYLAGILHPKQTKVSSEDDETTYTERNDDTASLTEPIAANSGMMPSSIGLTCRITKNTQKVRAKISFGRYKPIKKDDDNKYDVRYKREPFEEIIDLDIANPKTKQLEIQFVLLEKFSTN